MYFAFANRVSRECFVEVRKEATDDSHGCLDNDFLVIEAIKIRNLQHNQLKSKNNEKEKEELDRKKNSHGCPPTPPPNPPKKHMKFDNYSTETELTLVSSIVMTPASAQYGKW